MADTELEMEEALMRAERMAAVGTLASGVAHEFNNIHAIILGFLELVLADEDLSEKNREWLSCVQDAVERQWALLETAKEVIEALQDSYESWIQSRTNRIVRVLTIFSVTMLPLSVITGLYGMNVDLPYSQDPNAFLAIISILLLILFSGIAYFGWKKWL